MDPSPAGSPQPAPSQTYPTQSVTAPPDPRTGGDDAVCFTAGVPGAMFAAGTIHAYLAADRQPPAVVAGISLGALNAAALQRCYQELEPPTPGRTADQVAKREASRWSWYRRYLNMLTDEPFSAVWNGVPRQSDFAADLPPVRDASVDDMGDKEAQPYWIAQEKLARRELYLMMKLGNWLAGLPLRVSEVADYLVTHVRVKEKIAGWRTKLKYLAYNPAQLAVPLLWHLCLSPKFFREYKFQTKKYTDLKYYRLSYWFRPLFGWPVFLLAWLFFLPILVGAGIAAWFSYSFLDGLQHAAGAGKLPHELLFHVAVPAASFLSVLWFVKKILPLIAAAIFSPLTLLVAAYRNLARRFQSKGKPKTNALRRWIINPLSHSLFRSLELERSLVHEFHLRLRLAKLFGERGKPPRLKMTPMPVVLVAAPLQTLQADHNQRGVAQVWARKDARLVDALFGAMAVPGIFSPLHLERAQSQDPTAIDRWETPGCPATLDLVDGAVIRENPLPALFQFLKKQKKDTLAQRLSSSPGDPRVHVIFSAPLDERPSSLEPTPLGVNIVDVLFTSLRLNRRRDTKLEVQQTLFMSDLEFELRALRGKPSGQLYPIFADSISPEKELRFQNSLKPDPVEVLEVVAAGCRRSLEKIYIKDLGLLPAGQDSIPCHDFLVQIAPDRAVHAHPVTEPGLPEVCARCTRVLQRPQKFRPRETEKDLLAKYPTLTGEHPRIVFLASGGVFRGSFHAGMLACLLATDIRPDVIVGASVGTLLGGVLGSMLTAKNPDGAIDRSQSLRLLAELVNVLLHVDQEIAFTKTLKSALRELGIRARGIRLSPREIRRMVKRGSRSDPGFAATGAPPALIDAISNLLFIPHRNTSLIAADFVAGHVTQATKRLLTQMKTETLGRLDIKYSLMGVSLLEPTAYRLLGKEYGIRLDVRQPFRDDRIYFFGTTTNLLTESSRLLGRKFDSDPETYDVVQAALASSAFPAVFAPRRESDVSPGAGRATVLYSDGGMFDNLPFIPAIELLADVQRAYRADPASKRRTIEFLQQRHRSPDLFIAGALNVPPEMEEGGEGPFDDILTIARRADSLQANVKIRSFQDSADLIYAEVEELVKIAPKHPRLGNPHTIELLDGIVEASVLPVYPVDREHLNPTYAFCASLGLHEDRVQRSIVNGCFQTFAAMANAQSAAPSHELQQAARSMTALVPDRIPKIEWVPSAKSTGGAKKKEGVCPYFRTSLVRIETRLPGTPRPAAAAGGPVREFLCPFWEAGTPSTRDLYDVCCADQKHQKLWKDAQPSQPPPRWKAPLQRIAHPFQKTT
jgi:predicted acylesterase/phospholipase RssA